MIDYGLKDKVAIITGANNPWGIGATTAIAFAREGAKVVLVYKKVDRPFDATKMDRNGVDRYYGANAGNADAVESKLKEMGADYIVFESDISNEDDVKNLYSIVLDKYGRIDILINNAGFGLASNFVDSSLEKELDMIDLNVKTVHTLTKYFLQKFNEVNKGYILNVASSAAFQPGPLMATYYATKSYVYSLTMAISEELRKENSKVYIGCLCPGPVDTEFNKVANVEFTVPSLTSSEVVKYTLKKMFKRKLVIIPGFTMKVAYFFTKISPLRLKLKITYKIQKSKMKS